MWREGGRVSDINFCFQLHVCTHVYRYVFLFVLNEKKWISNCGPQWKSFSNPGAHFVSLVVVMAWQTRSIDDSRAVWSKRNRDLTCDWLKSKDVHDLEHTTLKHTGTMFANTEAAGCQSAHTCASTCQRPRGGFTCLDLLCRWGYVSAWTSELWLECVLSAVRPFKIIIPSVWNMERFKGLFFPWVWDLEWGDLGQGSLANFWWTVFTMITLDEQERNWLEHLRVGDYWAS